MKLRLLRIIALITIVTTIIYLNGGLSFLTGVRPSVRAVGDLSVDWGVPEGSPIFVINNIAPGDMEDRNVTITNDAPTIRPVAVRGVETSETKDLSTQLDLVISRDSTPIYGSGSPTGPKTLSQFFTESAGPIGLPLFILNSGTSSIVNFKVTFDAAADNNFQDASVIFDLIIGIYAEVPAECNPITFSGNPIFGTAGNDNLHGTNGNDLIFGFEGNDTINSSNGDDCVIGGEGNDKIHNSNGDDVVLGNEGNDRLNGSNGNDLMIGGPGNDRIDGSNGDDIMEGNEGDDQIRGTNGNDIIFGGSGKDNIDASNGNDQIFGNEGDDTIDAGNGNDNVEGNAGNDKIKGGNGNDILDGGPDIDTINGNLNIDTCNAETETNCEL